MNTEKVVKALSQDLTQGLFPSDRQLIPKLNDIYKAVVFDLELR